MTFPTLRRVLRLIPLFSLALALPHPASAAPLPLSRLYDHPDLALPVVSPDGKRVALRLESDGMQYLALMSVATQQMDIAAKFSPTQLLRIFWKTNSLIVLVLYDEDTGQIQTRSLDLETKQHHTSNYGYQSRSSRLLDSMPSLANEVLLQEYSANGLGVDLINVRTGDLKVIEKPSSLVGQWIVDGTGHAIAGFGADDERRFVQWRKKPEAPWQKRDLGPVHAFGLFPFAAHADGKRLLALDQTLPGTAAIVALDPETMTKEIIFQHPEVDAAESYESWTHDSNHIYGFRYQADRMRIFYIDAEAAAVQAALDQALPATVNEIVSASLDHQVLTIKASSDRDPGVYYVFDRPARRLMKIGPAYTNHNPAEMGAIKTFSFPGKDGLVIHGRLLLPPGSPARPPVLLVTHAGLIGPQSSSDFDARQQVYATRGYAVVTIDYRGTEGYGSAFLKAGDYQLGTGMVDDLFAGLDYIAAQGWVDPQRIGLLTTGTGGWVGLSALARSDRFKVWINENTILSRNGDLFSNLACSPKAEKDVIADFGGRAATSAYFDSVDPKSRLATLTLPSFHLYYSVWSYRSVDDAFIASTKLKGSSDRLVIAKVHPPSMERPKHAAELAAREQIFQFLHRWLPVEPTPASASK